MQQGPPPVAAYGGPGGYPPANNNYGSPQMQQQPMKQTFSPAQGDQLASQMANLQMDRQNGYAQQFQQPGRPPMGFQQPGPPPMGSPQAGPPPMGLPQTGPPPMGPPQGGPPPMGAPQGGPPPMGAPQGGPPSMGPPPTGAPPMGPPQTGAPPMGPPQSGAPPMGPPQSGAPPMGPPQSGAPPTSPPQGGAPHMGSQQNGFSQLNQRQAGPPQMGSPQMGPPQMGSPQTGPPRSGPPQMGPPQGGGPPMGFQQTGPPPMGPMKSGTHPMSPQQMNVQQNGGPPMGSPQMGPPQTGAPPMGSAPPGPPSSGPPPMGQYPPQGPVNGSPSSGPPMSGPPMSGPPPMGTPESMTSSNRQSTGVLNGRPGGFPMRPPMQQGPPGNQMMPQSPPAQNGAPNGPNYGFQPPPVSGHQTQQHNYNMGSPASPPGGQYPNPQQPQQQQPQIGQGFAQPPPPMYGQPNGQYPQQAVHQQQPYPGQPQQAASYPGQGPNQGHYPQPGYGGPQQGPTMQAPPQQPQRKLDPDLMPSPVQVIEDDRTSHLPGPFGTSKMGQLPPLVTTDVEVQDEGNAAPNYVRSTVYAVPCSPDITKQTQVPLALAITPFARHPRADGALPVSVFNEEIVRCNRCKAYMCPFMQFMDGGRRFQCVYCKATSEVPQGYFNHLDHMGQRVDKWQRAELCLGSYEVLATKEYCKNNVFPKPPAFIFVLDVSYNAIKCGMVQLFCHNIKEILQDLPTEEGSQEESGIRVGFITYSSQVHFYNIDKRLSQPQMMVVPDVADMFVPFLEGCLVKPSEAMHVIESLGQEIPRMFAETRETETILGPAIQAGLEALKASECAGKLFVFHTTLPTAEAPGKLKNRDDRKVLGTDKEKTVLTPGCPYYQELATQCVAAGCSVDLFVMPNSFVDLASIGQVAKLTGGQVYRYTYFQSDVDGERFLADLRRDVSKPIAFDAVMRVRTSTGIRPTDFYGNVYMQNTTDVELASVDCDKCVTVELKYDDKLPENECAFVQVALLYTSVSGQRKLRLHNLCLNTTQQMGDMFRNCELDVIMNLFCKQALRQILESSPKSVREGVTLRAATMLASYRKNCATASSSGQLILPECMKLLPLYVNCMMKCDALSGGPELSVDDRSFGMLSLSSMDVKSSQAYLYPRLLPVHDLDNADDCDTIPVALRTSVEKLREHGAYILENGILMFLYVGLQVDSAWCEGVFGVSSPTKIDVERGLQRLNTPASRRLHRLIDNIRQDRPRYMRLYLVRQGDKLELVLRQFLVEDRMSDSQLSYVDYLCQLHRDIRNLIS